MKDVPVQGVATESPPRPALQNAGPVTLATRCCRNTGLPPSVRNATLRATGGH